jgi:hypothetical protein
MKVRIVASIPKRAGAYDQFREAAEATGNPILDNLVEVVAETLNGGFLQTKHNSGQEMRNVSLKMVPFEGEENSIGKFLRLLRRARSTTQLNEDLLDELDRQFYAFSDEFCQEMVIRMQDPEFLEQLNG